MPSDRPVLTRNTARSLAAGHGFTVPSGSPVGCTGLEQEWLVVRLDDPARSLSLAELDAALAGCSLPSASRLTYEPGGQVELSTQPFPALDACRALATDAQAVGDALATDGIGLVALGLEPGPRRPRLLRTPRYDAMEAYFDTRNPAGRTMMRSTAALQVNVGLGDDPARRWEAAHALGPVLAAAFANSPFGDERPSGWRSTRLAVWAAIDGAHGPRYAPGGDCRDDWGCFALDAPLMLVRASDGEHAPVLDGRTFGDWVDDGHELGWPTEDDLVYHLTTLFPPVRPRGWLELRMIDALPAPWWQVASAITVALVEAWDDDPRVERAVASVRDRWASAARHALSDPCLAVAAAACFEIGRARLDDLDADAETVDATDEYVDRYVRRGRCPADDLLDRWHTTGEVLPGPENVREPAWA